jgi:hypothetical protein
MRRRIGGAFVRRFSSLVLDAGKLRVYPPLGKSFAPGQVPFMKKFAESLTSG